MIDRIRKLNSQCDPVNCEDPLKDSQFLKEKSLRKRDNDAAIMLDSDTSDDDTVNPHKNSKVFSLKME